MAGWVIFCNGSYADTNSDQTNTSPTLETTKTITNNSTSLARSQAPTASEILAAARARAQITQQPSWFFSAPNTCAGYFSTSCAKWEGDLFSTQNVLYMTSAFTPIVKHFFGNFTQENIGEERNDLGRTSDHAQARLYSVYQHALLDHPEMIGQISFTLQIRSTGQVMFANIASSQLKNPQLEADLLNIVNSMRFSSGHYALWDGLYTLNFYKKPPTVNQLKESALKRNQMTQNILHPLQNVGGLDKSSSLHPQKPDLETQTSNTGETRHDVIRIFQQNQDLINNLYKRTLADNPAMHGNVVIHLTIAPEGRVINTKVLSSEINNPQFEARLMATIRGFNFEAGSYLVWSGDYTLHFPPEP